MYSKDIQSSNLSRINQFPVLLFLPMADEQVNVLYDSEEQLIYFLKNELNYFYICALNVLIFFKNKTILHVLKKMYKNLEKTLV